MRLSLEDVSQFYRLHKAMMLFVNQRLRVIEETPATPKEYERLPFDARSKVHKAFEQHLDLIDAFIDENPFQFDEADLEIIRSWKHLVTGTFYAIRQLQKYMVFLSSTEPIVAYGVVALSDPFEMLLGPRLPRMLKTTLLPFKGKIVYDGIVSNFNITFGPGIRRRFNESYKVAKERSAIVTSLPAPVGQLLPAEPKAAVRKRATGTRRARGGSSAAETAHAAHDRIVALIDDFCRKHLDEEYQALCRKLAGVLARKRPSPLVSGKPETWASGIVRTIGLVNFLDDSSQKPHLKLPAIVKAFGVAQSTGQGKSKTIRAMLKIGRFDPKWTLPRRMNRNPMAWMISLNGLFVDARHLPREFQEQAFRKGLIPYLPGAETEDAAKE